MNLEQTGGISAWDCYNSIFLAEYYLVTGDANVFHGLSEYVIYAATHQSMYGTAGHGFSNIPPPGGWAAGGPHGSMSWYGPVNQAGLVAQLSIVLGKKAGVVSPEIDPAIARAANFFSYYVNRGSIPYGEHEPYPGDLPYGGGRIYYNHQSNGKDGLAAVFFGNIGDKPVPTEYYTRMAVAGYSGEEYGHTGQGFSYLWTTLGANVGGTNAVSEYLKRVLWHRDLTRRCDGSFVYDGGEQFGCSSANDYWAYTTYYDNPTAYYLLHAAIPRHQLYITGKNANPTNTLSAQVVSNALWASDFASTCGGYDTNQLVSALGEWDPIVRFNAATELSVRANGAALIPMLTVMAENPTNANQRQAACTALGCLGATTAVPALVRRLTDTDIWVRARAAKALGALGTSATAYLPAMLGAFVTNVAPTYPFQAGFNWDDPLQIGNGYLAETLFTKLESYTAAAAKSLLYPAVRAGIQQPAGMWRDKLSDFVQNQMTLPDVETLMLDVLQDASTEGPCDRMFTPGPTAAAMNVLSKYHLQEGIQVCASNVAYWGSVGGTAIARLADYGEAARWPLPDLYADLSWWTHDNNYPGLVSTVAVIEAATSSPALIYGLPEADPQVLATPANTARAITLTGSSCRTNGVTFTVATPPAHGMLTGTAPNLTYTPGANYQGMDSFTFTAADSLTNSSPATVDLAVGIGGGGLKAYYYDNVDFTSLKATMTNPAINFSWGTAAPTNTMGADTYSVRWTGQVLAPETGAYRFSTRTTDGVRLWVNGVQVINDWKDQAANLWNDSVPIALTAGQKYSLRMEYYRNVNPATVRLYWYIPSRQAALIIPAELLSPAPGVSLTSPLDGTRFGLPAGLPGTVILTAEVGDAGSSITNVSFYAGNLLIGSDATPPYTAAWTGVTAGQYTLTARATDNTGLVSTSAVAVITVDTNTVPVTAGLACHYDASYGVTANADGVVQSWTDRSGQAHHAALANGAPTLAVNPVLAKPVVQFRGNANWFNVAGGFFTKEQYVVVRSPNAAWSGSGSFLGRASPDFLTVRASSYNLYSGYTGFWDDQLPAAVSKNGTALASGPGSMPRGGFELGTITNFMILKITVNDGASAANLAAYPYYQIGQNETLSSCEMDLAEIIGYDHALSANDEAVVGSYLAAKYGISTPYHPAGFLANLPATGVATNTAVLNAALDCNGTNLAAIVYWGTANGGTNAAGWTRSAAVGSWTNTASTNLSLIVTGLAPSTTYYFTFRATNRWSDVWAGTVLNFTTAGPPLVDNAAGATNLAAGTAQLWATLANGPGDVRFCWGTTDAGTNGSWANTNLVSGAVNGPVSVMATNLLYGLPYYYRCSASNQYGMTWAAATAGFTTLPPQAPPALLVTNGLVCWYNASYGVATNGSGVMTWEDQSGFGHQAARGSGTVTLVANDVNSLPAVHLRGSSTWLNCAGGMFVKEQYLVVRSPNVLWNGSGSFLGRKSDNFLTVRASSYNLDNGTTGFWQDHFPAAVSKNGTSLAQNQTVGNGPGFQLGTLTDYMILKIIVDNTADAANLAAYPYYQIGKNETLGTMDFDVAEIIGYGATNSAADEARIASYLAAKYAVTTAYPAFTGPPATTLTNSAATGVTGLGAMLHATLGGPGSVYGVVACWNTVNGGTNAALWTNSAYAGTWTNAVSTNLSLAVSGLRPQTQYYFTFRATNAVDTLWAANVQSFTTLPALTPPAFTGSGISLAGGVPGFTFSTVAGYKYRLAYKNALTDSAWLPVIAPPAFPLPAGWSAAATGSPMSLNDTNTAGQPQRFYRIEAANP